MKIRLRFLATVSVLVVLSINVAMASVESVNTGALKKSINDDGPAAVAKRLWGTNGWNQLTGNIITGKKEWIDVALLISPGTDAGMTEELRDALFLAMTKNPAYLLKKLPEQQSDGHPISINDVCSGRSDPAKTYEVAINEVQAVKAAVMSVRNDVMSNKWKLCVSKLAIAESDLKRFFEE